jgi:hypothetical protein
MPPPAVIPVGGRPIRPGVSKTCPVAGAIVGDEVLRATSFSAGNEVSSVGSGMQPSPTRFWPLGQTRVSCFSIVVVAFGKDAGRLALFVSEGKGAHSCELFEQTEANVHDGTRLRLIRMAPPASRVTSAVCPRSSNWAHFFPAQTLA